MYCKPDGEPTKSGSSLNTQAPFPPCHKSPLDGITCCDWSISTYLHIHILTFRNGGKSQIYLREKCLFFVWQWQIICWPWHCTPIWPTYTLCSLQYVKLFVAFESIYQLSLAFSYTFNAPSILSLCLAHSSHLLSPMLIHLRAAEAHSTPYFVAPSIMTDCRPNRTGGKKSNDLRLAWCWPGKLFCSFPAAS